MNEREFETLLASCPTVDYGGLRCCAWDDRACRGAQEQVSLDDHLLDIFSHRQHGALLRLWRNRHCLVASAVDRRAPDFNKAVRSLAQDGITVALRRSGGTVVPQFAGVLNLSLVYRMEGLQSFSIAAAYERLLQPLIRMLNADGVPAGIGEVLEAFCNGRYDLVVDGRKMAGTAQRVRRAEQGIAVLSHLSLYVNNELALSDGLVNRFYRLCGNGRRVAPGRTTRVSDHQREFSGPDAVDRFARKLLRTLGAQTRYHQTDTVVARVPARITAT